MPGPQDTTEIVTTQLRVAGTAAYSSALRAVSGVAGMAGSAISMLTDMFNPLNLALGGLGTGLTLNQIAEVNSQFEESQRLIAGIFTTMGMAGDFNAGLSMAAQTMDMITVAAARLPGEAEDYINVFQTGLTVVRQTFSGSTRDLTEFTNQFTAIMSTLGVSSMEAGMSLTRALASGRGQVDQQSMAFMRLLPFIQQATAGMQHQVTSIQEFNRLTQQQRGEVLRLTLAQDGLSRMLEDAGDSWNAQTGALTSMVSMMTRMATSPLFEAMKSWLSDFNALFMDSEGHLTTLGAALTAIGEYLSNTVVGGINSLMEFLAPAADSIYSVGKTVLDELGPVVDTMRDIFSTINPILENFWPLMQTLTESLRLAVSGMGSYWPMISSFLEFMARINTVIGHGIPILTAMFRIVNALSSVQLALLRVIMQLAFGTENADVSFNRLIIAIDATAVLMEMFASYVERGAQSLLTLINAASGALGLRAPTGGIASTLANAIAEARAKAESRQHEAGGAGGAGTPTPPPHRPSASVHQDFRYSRFDILQRFAEGFDPDRIAVAFADDVGRLGEQRLQSGLEPIFGVR